MTEADIAEHSDVVETAAAAAAAIAIAVGVAEALNMLEWGGTAAAT